MKRIAKLLEGELVIKPDVDEEDEPQTSVTAMADANTEEEDRFSEHTPTVAILTSLDASALIIGDSACFDPYNSGSFESSKSRLKK